MMGTGDDIKGSRLNQQEQNPIDEETILTLASCVIRIVKTNRELAPQLRVCIMLCLEDLSVVSSTHIWKHTATYNSKASNDLFWPLGKPTHTHTHTLFLKIKCKKLKLKKISPPARMKRQ